MNQHNPPTESEVRASLWARCKRLEDHVSELKEQRGDLLKMLAEVIRASDLSGHSRQPTISRALQLIENINDIMETE